MPVSDQLQTYTKFYQDAQLEAHALVDAMSDTQFNWKPSGKSWSVGECIEHLNIVGLGYLPVLPEAVRATTDERGRDRAFDEPFTYGWIGRKFIASLTLGSRKIPTGSAMDPTKHNSSSLTISKSMATFDSVTEGFVNAIEASQGLDLSRIKVTSPFLRLVRFPLGVFLEALGLHALRHVDQARRVTQMDGFPRS